MTILLNGSIIVWWSDRSFRSLRSAPGSGAFLEWYLNAIRSWRTSQTHLASMQSPATSLTPNHHI